jgi:beta-glucosidase-like glycosyl hydrolase
VRRTQRQLFTLGRFDPPTSSPWTQLDETTINSTEHRQVQYEAALQGLVLLKNDAKMLPLRAGSRIAVVGPQGSAKQVSATDDHWWPLMTSLIASLHHAGPRE